ARLWRPATLPRSVDEHAEYAHAEQDHTGRFRNHRVRAEGQEGGKIEPTAGGEVVDEGARAAVVTLHLGGEDAANVEVSVGAEPQAAGAIEPTAGGEVVD